MNVVPPQSDIHNALPRKVDIFGTGISCTSMDELMRIFEHRARHTALVVNVCNVHSVVSARSDAQLAAALSAGEVNAPDGKPLVWRLHAETAATQIRGTDLTWNALAYGVTRGWRHYFYGSQHETLRRLTNRLAAQFPGVTICGATSPPFRELDDHDLDAAAAEIRTARADFVWVGLGMPKQEKWMHRMRGRLSGTVMIGIGAAFDFIAGTKPEAPLWMQRNGLEWAFRLASEPRRLWRRYLRTNSAFLGLCLKELVLDGKDQ